MEVLASRCILHPRDMVLSRHFYEQILVCGFSMSMVTAGR